MSQRDEFEDQVSSTACCVEAAERLGFLFNLGGDCVLEEERSATILVELVLMVVGGVTRWGGFSRSSEFTCKYL